MVSSLKSFNPLVHSFDNLSDIELEEKILELNKKFWMTHNPQVKEQITYKAEMEGRRAKAKKINSQDGDNSLDNLINIS